MRGLLYTGRDGADVWTALSASLGNRREVQTHAGRSSLCPCSAPALHAGRSLLRQRRRRAAPLAPTRQQLLQRLEHAWRCSSCDYGGSTARACCVKHGGCPRWHAQISAVMVGAGGSA